MVTKATSPLLVWLVWWLGLLPCALSTALKPLAPVRRCYVPPLREGGCTRLQVLLGAQFGLNRYGQETTAQRLCLKKLREVGGNTFVFAQGTCDLWNCSSADALTGTSDNQQSSLEQHNSSPSVFSELCDYQELNPSPGIRRSPVFVKLWEWNYVDIGKECQDFLGPNGFDAVQVSPVTEHKLGPQWWTKYQPVSFSLSSRSGSMEDFAHMVAACRASGVQVMVDLIINHIATPCRDGRGTSSGTPCVGWNGSLYGNRRLAGARGWDAAGPEHFNHLEASLMENCIVGPPSWTCKAGSIDVTDCSCCSCDFLKLPDWNTGLPAVHDMHLRHVHELHDIGVTMLRIDLSLFESIADLSNVLSSVPWDFVYQEWWWEKPDPMRHRYIGHFRDITYRYLITHYLGNSTLEKLPEALTLSRGHDQIRPETSVYPIAFHDGRTWKAKPGNATYKNGLEFHQQQKFILAWPRGSSILLWGGFGWSSMSDGPPGCDFRGEQRCQPQPVFLDGQAQCMTTPRESPLPADLAMKRTWVCEHRWEGVAGLIEFRKACRGLAVTRTWKAPEVSAGRLAFRAGEDCFAALVRGYNTQLKSEWGHLGASKDAGGGLHQSPTQRGWDRKRCPRQVVIGTDGRILSGIVLEGDLLAIHVGGRMS
ncbi:amy [Symbiodinium microadriaticum]|nr:amy [Symbiodinium microadriaticum]